MHGARLAGGIRRVMQVSEIVADGSGGYRIEDIFGFEQTGVDNDGMAVGEFFTTGYQPLCFKSMRAAGVPIREEMFRAQRFSVPVDRVPGSGSGKGHASYLTR